jgi:hypothetical protein
VIARIPDMEPAAERLKHDFADALHVLAVSSSSAVGVVSIVIVT